jgi:hypothetical protein
MTGKKIKPFKLMQPKIAERDIQKSIVEYMKMFGYEVHRMPLGPVVHRKGKGEAVKTFWKAHPLKGFPDLFTFSKHRIGRLITIECKSKTGKLEPEQLEWKLRLEQAGCLYVSGSDVALVVNEIRERDTVF